MNSAFSILDLASLAVAVAALSVTIAIFYLGRRLSFRQQRERVRELETKAWEVLGPIRTQGLNNKVIVMNTVRYKRGYDGTNNMTRHGYAYSGPELIEIVHGGLEVIIGGVASYYDAHGDRTLTEATTPAPTVIQSGHIPWKWIEDIAPKGDEFDGSAIFFVRHDSPGRSPYDYITYREGRSVPFGPNDRSYYEPIPELGTWRPRFIREWWCFAKLLWQERKMHTKTRRVRKDTA